MTATVRSAAPEVPALPDVRFLAALWRAARLAITVTIAMIAGAILLRDILSPLIAAAGVTENFTVTLASVLMGLLPVGVYLGAGTAARRVRQQNFVYALVVAWAVSLAGYGVLVAYQAASGSGSFSQAPTLGFAMQQADKGISVTTVDAGGAAEAAGLQTGDVITALRRDALTADELQSMIRQAQPDDAFRLRLLRGTEELQLTVRAQLAARSDTGALLRGAGLALIVSLLALVIPAQWVPHVLLLMALLPLFAGYLWLIIATFSRRTHGLLPLDTDGNIGGFTLANWGFLTGENIGGPRVNIWTVTFNSFFIASVMTIASLVLCSMTGYALSRMNFPGRRAFLSLTLVLHGFPAVTLLIPIFLVLINLGKLPILGNWIGYNTPGGVALVMIAFEMPLGTWLIKGFFDTISWDMERSGLIDGASRWRVFWEIILPQIRPGLLALGIFSFIGGWNSYLIPATYSVGTGLANLPVYIRQLSGELAPVNWNQVAAVGLFQLIPIFLFFIFAQEYLLNIYAGGTKGSS